ncbi:MAG: hybrid sensor histidine kinase/response regulator [Herpetosiphon sp.]|nr:hybrid sensor histidine kinase/response regulator [Herpetosiphon sp.]
MNNSTRILYIEDNADNQRLVRRVLNSRGYVLDIAPEGTTGLRMANDNRPDLILMDINLPGLNGHELTTKFKALPHLSAIPIIAITANTTPGDRERALAAGCDGYISKPIDPRALPDQVASYIGGTREALPNAEVPTFMREYSQQLVMRLENHVRKLEAANERLVKLDRAKNEFLATISHELRTPLTVIHGYIDLLNMQALGTLNDGQRDAVELIRKNSVRLLRHINDLLYLQQVRSSSLETQRHDLRALIGGLCNEMQPNFVAKEQQLIRSLGSAPVWMMFDAHAIDNALRHLLENANLYTPNRGIINVMLQTTKNEALVVIRDNGIGIDEKDHARVFEQFVRLDETLAQSGGAGLGLVIASHVAQAHGGRITLDSSLGIGSTFTLHLPLKAGEQT